MRKITLTQIFTLAIAFMGISTMAQTNFYIDFNQNTTATYVTPGNWNNYHDAAVGTLTDIISDGGVASTIDMAITDAFVSANGTGTTTPDAALPFPATATSDSFYIQDGANNTGAITISSLDPTKVYSFLIFASRAGVSDTRIANYSLVGANSGSATLDASNNTANTCSVNAIQPTAGGQIVLTVTKDPTSTGTFAYIGCMKMTETTPVAPQVLMNAENGSTVDGEFFIVDAVKIHVMANGNEESVSDFELVSNPNPTGVNTSANVIKFTRRTTSAGNIAPWSGFWAPITTGFDLPDFTVNKYVHVKILKQNTTNQRFKIEGGAAGTIEIFSANSYTDVGQWQDIVFDFSSKTGTYSVVGLQPDFEDPVIAGADRIIYFDDIIVNNNPTPTTAGIHDNYLTSKIFMFPNPTQNILNIDTLEELQAIQIFTIEGRQVIVNNEISLGENQIDISALNVGVYFVKFTATNGATLTQKIIKE